MHDISLESQRPAGLVYDGMGVQSSLLSYSHWTPLDNSFRLKFIGDYPLLRPTLRRPYLLPEEGPHLLTPSTYAVDDCEFGGGGAPS